MLTLQQYNTIVRCYAIHCSAQLDLHTLHLMIVMLLTIVYVSNVKSDNESLQGERIFFVPTIYRCGATQCKPPHPSMDPDPPPPHPYELLYKKTQVYIKLK